MYMSPLEGCQREPCCVSTLLKVMEDDLWLDVHYLGCSQHWIVTFWLLTRSIGNHRGCHTREDLCQFKGLTLLVSFSRIILFTTRKVARLETGYADALYDVHVMYSMCTRVLMR